VRFSTLASVLEKYVYVLSSRGDEELGARQRVKNCRAPYGSGQPHAGEMSGGSASTLMYTHTTLIYTC